MALFSVGATLAVSAGLFRQGLLTLRLGRNRPRARDALDEPTGETVRCFLTTHPHGWHLRLERDDELVRTQVLTDQAAVFDAANAWRVQLESRNDG